MSKQKQVVSETSDAVSAEASVENENLESNPTKQLIRSIKANQIFSARFKEIEMATLCGAKATLEKMLILRSDMEGKPIHIDCVEYNPARSGNFKLATINMFPYVQTRQATMINDDFFNVMNGHIVNKSGFGFVRGDKKDFYNVADFDFCGNGTTEIIDDIVKSMKNSTQEKSINYITFSLTGARVEDGKEGLLKGLNVEVPKDRMVTTEDVRQAILVNFNNAFAKYRMQTNTVKIMDIVYNGGTHSIMITIGFAKNIRNIKKVQENWREELEINTMEALKALKDFQNNIMRKLHSKKISVGRKSSFKIKRREIKDLELEKKNIIKTAIRILGRNGWENDDIAKEFKMETKKASAIVSWTRGDLKKKDKFVDDVRVGNKNIGSSKWFSNVRNFVKCIDNKIELV